MDFHPIKVPRTRVPLYMLSIRAPLPPFLPIETWIFPLSPGTVRKTAIGMSAIYDTAGPPEMNGVMRNVDSYGLAPFVYDIEGTTGWDRHMTDGYLYTGLQAIQRVQRLLANYARYNQVQRQSNIPYSYSLEFSDFFNGEFYQVEPVGPQEFSQSERAPLLQYYRFRLIGIRPTGSPLINAAISDRMAALFALPIPGAVASVMALAEGYIANYTVAF